MGEDDRKPTPRNETMFQGFEWNCPADGKHYQRLAEQIPKLASLGITNLWLPPGCKGSSPEGNGHDIYDLYDLGEFDQKGSVRTKWGTKEDLLSLSKVAKDHGVGLYWDAVLNHKAGADEKEKCKAVEVDNDDRTKEVSGEYEINAWVGFTFPGRGDKYSNMKYHWHHFSGTDYNDDNGKTAIYKIAGRQRGWSRSVDKESGNADYMMFADIDYSHPEVQADVKNWGPWIVNEVGLAGFRLDAVQHFSETFTNEWIDFVNEKTGNKFYVGEFWTPDVEIMNNWLEKMGHKFSFYDAPLVYNFSKISTAEKADLRKVFDNTLVQSQPYSAVTVVANHDTQPGQTMATEIASFFKPLAYALILLRDKGYPCPFYGDLYGTLGNGDSVKSIGPSCSGALPNLILARKLYAYGDMNEYMDAANVIGFVRRGTWDHPAGLACVMSNAEQGTLRMCVGDLHRGQVWTDVLGWSKKEVEIDHEGYGEFEVGPTSVSVYVRREAEGRDQFGKFDSVIYEEGVVKDA